MDKEEKVEDKKYSINPSKNWIAIGMEEKYRMVKNNGPKEVTIAGEKREVLDHYRERYLEDMIPFVKLFPPGLIALAKLNASELRILCYIIGKLEINKEKFFLFRNITEKETGKSAATVSNAIDGLLQTKFIFKSETRYEYFINVSYLYKGDRVALYKEHVNTQK